MIDFKAPYSPEAALEFLYNFLPDDFQKFNEEVKIDFKPQFIRNIRKIGEVASLENTLIYEITHESENDPRVSLSKDSFRLLAHFNVRKALIFFVSKTSPNYRLSLVTLDLKWESGTKVKREYSNPRRYSFFLGPDARVHTPNDFLIKKDRVKDAVDLLSRFDVEIVTRKFFTEYKGLFEDVSGYLEKDHGFKIFAEKNNINIDTFSKKLLGQIVFCYFLQRKGWLGAKEGEIINKGDKDFMRSLFDRCSEGKNFYNDYLEYLFYGALNTRAERPGDFYRKHFDRQIPFLNGGLFEPPEDYDWERSFVHIPDKLFSNKESTGILDVFDLYNFTVYEDDPIDREVSVDPEMLGKVFENLLPENLRKGQGAYYTPREIVHYMCQESLINYLAAETKVDIEKIRNLVVNKHFEGEGSRDTIDKVLQNIKVCDPACGSGAFLVGMLHEIVSARHILNPKEDEYYLRKETIQNCIYGVDIDPGAVEIAKLRLWLSLVVDYELKDIEPLPNFDYKIMCGNSLLEEFEGVKFYNGSNGDSASLFKDERKQKIQELREKTKEYFNIYDEKEKRKKREEINRIKDWFIKATLEKRRKEITRERRKIEAKANMFEEENRQEYFTTQGEIFISEAKINEVLRELHNPQKARPFFIWNLEFMDVFEEKRGFDVVIANPPYIGEKDHKELFRVVRQGSLGVFYKRRMDLFYFFFHIALNLLKIKGQLAFITTNYYLSSNGARILREDFKKRSIVKKLINFNELKIFKSALGQHNIITILEKNNNENYLVDIYNIQRQGVATTNILKSIFDCSDETTIYYSLKQKELYKGEELVIGLPLKKSIRITSLLEKIKDRSKPLSNYCEIRQGIITGADKVTSSLILKYKKDWIVGQGIFVLNENDLNKLNLNQYEKRDLIKNWITTDEIQRFFIKRRPKRQYLIYITKDNDINRYPNIKKHLEQFEVLLRKKRECKDGLMPWYSLNWPRKKEFFEQEKILTPYRCEENRFGYDSDNYYTVGNVPILFKKEGSSVSLKFIISLLNSKLLNFWYKHEGKDAGGGYKYYLAKKNGSLSNMPIVYISEKDQRPFIDFVDKILFFTKTSDYLASSEKQAKVKEYECQIDQMVYKLYELAEEEIKIIEDFQKGN